LKDSIGKGDIHKISVPVYFNDPTSILQKCAQSMEYNDMLELIIAEQDPLRRISLVGVYMMTHMTVIERVVTKPFNPILGETYEFCTDKWEYLAE
jgi:oxysterol-binding protein 1